MNATLAQVKARMQARLDAQRQTVNARLDRGTARAIVSTPVSTATLPKAAPPARASRTVHAGIATFRSAPDGPVYACAMPGCGRSDFHFHRAEYMRMLTPQEWAAVMAGETLPAAPLAPARPEWYGQADGMTSECVLNPVGRTDGSYTV